MRENWVSSGLNNLDEIIKGFRKEDNVVWQVDNLADFKKFAEKFSERSIAEDNKLIYMRFADHKPLVDTKNQAITTYHLNPEAGFEAFTSKVYNIITSEGEGAHYIFDSLSELLTSWATDLMIGNFFKITCPYLFELDTIAYFALIRNQHSFKTVAAIRETTQLFLNLYQHQDTYYLHPIKVWNRHSPTMFLPHKKEGTDFTPITDSFNNSKLFSNILTGQKNTSHRKLDYWDKLFLKANQAIEADSSDEKKEKLLKKIATFLLSKNEQMLDLIKEHFSLKDLLAIKSRLIGTGKIGGKALGMLTARKIIENKLDFKQNIIEPHDSFFIGSDVFYSYIVHNGWWKLRIKQQSESGYFKAANQLKEKFLTGSFPEQIVEQFRNMLNYFGQAPIIVRSSSFLEDGYGNAFAGKYDSFFSVNQGSPEARLEEFIQAVKKVYASSMNKDALVYRRERGLANKDEQMSILVQRVSGDYHNSYFFPDTAGVAISYNTFAWNKDIDPQAGMLRIVFGMGTRAVDRINNDYARIVALDNVLQKNYSTSNQARKYSQRYLDLLDLTANQLATVDIADLLTNNPNFNRELMNLIADRDYKAEERLKELNLEHKEQWVINFDDMLTTSNFTKDIKRILAVLEAEYDYPVDIEFTANYSGDNTFKINLLQCRPLQTNFSRESIEIADDIADENTLFSGEKQFMGGSFATEIKQLIYVNPKFYTQLTKKDKYQTARLIGKLNKILGENDSSSTMLIGPGRWGSTTPSLGVPINFSEINHISILVETATAEMKPELSFGSHFFQDLVETDIKYFALTPKKDSSSFDNALILNKRNSLTDLLPEATDFKQVIHLLDLEDNPLKVAADIISNKFIAYWQ